MALTPVEEFSKERSVSIIQEDIKIRTGYEKIHDTFKKVECIRFVPSSKSQGVCQCGRVFEFHGPDVVEGEPGEVWNPDDEKYTRQSPTDAFGEVEFQGVWTSTRAKYVRVAHNTPASDILDLLTNTWVLPLPKLLIEVTGGAKDFVLQPKLKRIFRKGIVKVAVSTDAWILTGGTNTGVMKHVGEALREHTLRSRHKIIAIGVVSWGIVDGNAELEDRKNRQHARVKHYRLTSSMESSGASLDPNHTHFILVDNGTVGKFGVEIELRSNLEKLMSNQKMDPTSECGIPAVCLVLEGGLNTIRVVLENITKDPIIPVVIAEGSGRGADLIAYAYCKSDVDGTLFPEHEERLRRKIEQTFPSNRDKHERIFKDLLEVIKRKEMITIYSVEADDDMDIDYAILSALMKASNLSPSEQLKLSLIWNRVDLAKEKIFNKNYSWDELYLDEAMEVALVRNRVDFVKLLLETGCYMKSFVTSKRLERLYSSIDSMDGSEPFPTLCVLYQHANLMPPKIRNGRRHFKLQDIGHVIQCLLGKGFACNYTANSDGRIARCKMCHPLTGCFRRSERDESDSSESPNDFESFPFNDLFLWAILTKKYGVARLMWQRGRETLAKALIGARLYHGMSQVAKSKYNTDAADRLAEEKRWYENLSVELLMECFEEDAGFTRLLLCAQLDNWSEQTCLSLAAAFNHSRFIAHPSIQFLLNDQWYGVLSKISSMKEFIEWMFPATISNSTDEVLRSMSMRSGTAGKWGNAARTSPDCDDMQPANGPRRHSMASVNSYGLGIRGPTFKRRLPFYTYGPTEDQTEASFMEKVRMLLVAPIFKFWINTVFYFVFLLMFSFVVLVDIQGDIMVVEWLVACNVLTLAGEELRQVLMMGEHGRLTLGQKLKMWASDKWNMWDLLGVTLYIPGFVFRLCTASGVISSSIQPLTRMFLCLDVMVWYIRLLDVCSVNNVMGPYVNMIGNMIRDLVYFMLILLVFLVSYGVARQAILFPRSEWQWSILAEIFRVPYLQVYGELFPDEDDGEPVYNITASPSTEGGKLDHMIVTAIMCVYLMISNVLLLNLLIAIFNNTFTRVHDNASEIWKFQRYRLIMEYSEKPFLPPPFTIIIHVTMVIRKMLYSCCRNRFIKSDMKDLLNEPSMQLLYNFEEECTENYMRQKTLETQTSVNGTIQRISERVDTYSNFVEEQQQRDIRSKESVRSLTERLDAMETTMQSMMKLLGNAEVPDEKKGTAGKVTST